MLCPKDTSEKLCCPAESSRGDLGSGYQTLTDNLLAFSNIGCLPKNIYLDKLDDGEGMHATFEHHRARWHESCRLEYNKTKLFRAEKRKTSCERRTDVPRKHTRQSVDQPQPSVDKCFFCDGQAGKGTLHEASTFEIDADVRKCALKLEDKRLLAKLSGGDLIAQEANYHATCLTSLYHKARGTKWNEDPDQDDVNQGIALAELVSYIEEARMDSDVAPVFKLIDLATLYMTRLEQLGTVLTGRVHTTELKNRILRYFPNLEEHKRGRDILLAFNEDVGAALRMACEQDADSDGIHLARAANIVRRDMLKMTTSFSGSFDTLCQEESVPNSLIALVSMILNGHSFVSFNRWLDQMTKMVTADTPLTGDETVSWAAYHASKQSAPVDPSSLAITSLPPLFRDQSNSVAMIRHSMDVIKTAVDILNPGQVPVITADQPLYTLAKQIQWNWPQTHGEDYFVILFAGFHIEKASFNTLGDLLDCSGWTEALVQAGVATPGTADSFIKAAHVTRTRWAHQVTASVLYLLRQEGYTQYCDELDDGHVAMSVEEWCDTRADASPQFKFWSIILKLELEIMIYVRSLREGDFKLYVDALTKIAPWFFALGHTHYARWIPVHLRDMVALEDKHPDVFA